ncbi:MAG: hypothetical protein ACOC5T_01060 [Elusimicrobiota bacterium]
MSEIDNTKLTSKEIALINGDFGSYMTDENGNRLSITEAVREITKILVTIHDKAKISLAEMLHEIYSKSYFNTWGYEKFMDYVEEELDFQYRQAMYLIEIYQELVEKRKIPIDFLRNKSWTKLREIAGKTKDESITTEEVRKLIEDSDEMTVEEVVYRARELSSTSDTEEIEKTHRITFTLYEEQYENVKKALDAAEEVSTSVKPGANLDLICTEFIASHMHGDKEAEVRRIAKELEGILDIEILITDDSKVIYANKKFDE